MPCADNFYQCSTCSSKKIVSKRFFINFQTLPIFLISEQRRWNRLSPTVQREHRRLDPGTGSQYGWKSWKYTRDVIRLAYQLGGIASSLFRSDAQSTADWEPTPSQSTYKTWFFQKMILLHRNTFMMRACPMSILFHRIDN